MAKRHISTHLREYYEAQQPSAKRLAHLVTMVEIAKMQAPGIPVIPTKTRTDHASSGFRPVFVLFFAVTAALAFFFFRPTHDVTQSVAKEIVLNHNKRLAVEFTSENYAELGAMMSKLDFSLLRPKQIETQGFRVLGGRYCSIQGNLAAQIRLADETGRIHTLYQSALTEDLKKLQTGDLEQDGLKLTLWREGGLLFGLAGPIN